MQEFMPIHVALHVGMRLPVMSPAPLITPVIQILPEGVLILEGAHVFFGLTVFAAVLGIEALKARYPDGLPVILGDPSSN